MEDNNTNLKSIAAQNTSTDISNLISLINNNSTTDTELINKAYKYASESHKDQYRLSGELYITHPVEVAKILASLKLDTTTICAALLHDVIEDTKVTIDILKKEFNEEIALLVDGVTKISSLKKKTKYDELNNLRKMLLATVNDVRVILIKLADKLHNMRTINYQPESKQETISKEVLDIYAPIAHRLGMSKIASELEDIAFKVLYPEEYKDIAEKIVQKILEMEIYINYVQEILTKKFIKMNINAQITGRAKHYYSIFRKMKIQEKNIADIFDIRAIRIIVDEVKDCYGILGIIHSLWSPITARFKDYIAVPKSNMYQSLHTTVIGPYGHPLEFQIRTKEMHATAEDGIAAHWLYKEDPAIRAKTYKNITLLKNIQKRQFENEEPKEFLKELKMDLYADEIFTFTPKGKIIKLAKGSTPVDFAYAIHTEVGHHCIGANVNNNIVPLKTELKSGDIIEIRTGNKEHPSESWLKFVKSSNARYKIRSWQRREQENISSTSREQEQKTKKTIEVSVQNDELFKIKNISKQINQNLIIDGTSNLQLKLSQCCQPIPGDDVIGFITRGRGLTVHKKTCASLNRLKVEAERFINIIWEATKDTYPVKISINALDRQNLIKDIANEIASLKVNIIKMEADAKHEDNVRLKFILEVKSTKHLNDLIHSLKNIKSVTSVHKLNEKVLFK
jgi:GTP diphosphokinase / guanosine-3',5'-bis(diphosphate) 3'-diphosphatase